METRFEGHIDGVFEGYEGGRVHVLSDGSRWRQDDTVKEYVYRERPRAKLLWEQSLGQWFLDVEGTSHTVSVVRDSGFQSFGHGAF
jgi:hypothetical protein